MGNTPTCVDCSEVVPKTVRFFDKIPFCNGRAVYRFFTNKNWTKLSDQEYLCPYCLTKRQENERREENRKREQERRERMAAERQRIENEKRHKADRQRRMEAEQRRREEEARQRMEAERRRQEEAVRQQRIEAERRRQEEAVRQQRIEAERRRQEEAVRQQRIEAERKRQEEVVRQQRIEAERRRQEEAVRQQRIEAERRRQEEAVRQQRIEAERRRQEEAVRQQRIEGERRRQEEAARQRMEVERRRQEEEARQRMEAERRRQEEEARQQSMEAERRRLEEEARQHRLEGERKRQEEAARQQRLEDEQRRQEEAARQQRLEYERRRQEEAARQQRLEDGRRRQEEEARQQWMEAERRRQVDTHQWMEAERRRQEQEDALMQQWMEAERRRQEQEDALRQQWREAERISQEEAARQQCIEKRNVCHGFDDIDSWITKQKTCDDGHSSVMITQSIQNDSFDYWEISREVTERQRRYMDGKKDDRVSVRESSTLHLTFETVYDFALQNLRKSSSCKILHANSEQLHEKLIQLLDSKLSVLVRQCEIGKNATLSPNDVKVCILGNSTFDTIHILLIAIFCVSMEHATITSEIYSFVYREYLVRQRQYGDNTLSLALLLRKICDALVVMLSDSGLCCFNNLIESVLEDLYEKLLNMCIPFSYMRTYLTFIKSDLNWKKEDLLYLMWHVANEEIGLETLIEIKVLRLKAESIIKRLFTTPHNVFENLTSATELPKTVIQVVKELEMQESLDYFSLQRLQTVWTFLDKRLQRFGYHDDPARTWQGRTRSVDVTLLKCILSKTDIAGISDYELSNCIAEIFLAVKIAKQFWPRSTQYASLFLLIESIGKGRLLEINTGEGKTCIIAMFAVFLAMSGKSVDIVSSSAVLAQRDSEEWKDFYELFNLPCGSNLTQKESVERLECYKKPIVYGTVSSFSSDILRQEFLMENTRGTRRFDAVIVDEVDCMLLDHGVNFTYLSSAAPGMHHIEPIMLMIWSETVSHPMIRTDQAENLFLGKPEPVHVFLAKLFTELPDSEDQPKSLQILYLLEKAGVLREGFTFDFRKQNPVDKTKDNCFRSEMDKQVILQCLRFVETKSEYVFNIFDFCDQNSIRLTQEEEHERSENTIELLVVGEGLVCQLFQDKETLFDLIEGKISEILRVEESKRKVAYEIPSYLLDFVKDRLPKWIENAFLAKGMTPGREYLVRDQEIVPVDYESTGVVELDTKWGDGLHQFLEIKHNKKLSPMTLVTNFLSNQGFFKRYPKRIYGVSGTLGSKLEIFYLKRRFELTCTKVPTHLKKKFIEIPGIVCSSRKEWVECVQQVVYKHVSKEGKRAVLIVCEDINTAEEISRSVQTGNRKPVTLFTRNDQEDISLSRTFCKGDVIVATNIAGRGTDIEISDKVAGAGGLLVLVTFLPKNVRVENQVFGRSARKGQPGSAQIIISKESLPGNLQGFSDIEDLKSIRDDIEEERMKDLEGKLLKETEQKEALFKIYCNFIQNTASMYKTDSTQGKIVVSSLHEFWGLWLKMHSELINNKTKFSGIKYELETALKQARIRVDKTESPTANLYHIIHFANERLAEKDYDQCERLYSQAIQQDRKWAAVAFYNRAYCIVLQAKPGYISRAIKDLKQAKKCFCQYKNEVALAISLLCFVNQNATQESDEGGTITQFQTRCQILSYLDQNIDTAVQSLEDLQRNGKDARGVGSSIFTITFGEDRVCKKIDSELHMFWELGLNEIVTVDEKPQFSWKGLLVAVLGVLQIAVGTFAIACSSGLLSQLGWGLVAEGINDICTGLCAIYNNDQNFVKSWMCGKAASLAISVASFGFSQAKIACQGTKGIKSAAAAMAKSIKSGPKELIANVKEIPSTIVSKSFRTALKETCKEVAIHTTEKICERGSKYMLEVANTKLKVHFENETHQKLRENLKTVMAAGQFKDMLAKFIIIEQRKDERDIAGKFIKISENLVTSKNIRQFRQILMGCVKDLLNVTKTTMKTNKSTKFSQFLPIFEMIANVKCKSYNVKQLVDIYCEHVMKAFTEIYSEELTHITEETINEHRMAIAEVSTSIEKRVSDHLFTLIQQSFSFTGDSLLAEKLGAVVQETVSKFSSEHGIGKDSIQRILSISKQGKQFVKCLKEKDFLGTVDHGLALTETGAKMLCTDINDKTKINFFTNVCRKGMQFAKEPSAGNITMTVLNITADGVNTFGDENTKKTAGFALKATKTGVNALQSRDAKEVFNTALEITADGVNTFGDEKTKKTAGIALKATKTGLHALQSRDAKEVFNTALEITADGVNTFGDEKTKKTAGFALNATKTGLSALQRRDAKEVLTLLWK